MGVHKVRARLVADSGSTPFFDATVFVKRATAREFGEWRASFPGIDAGYPLTSWLGKRCSFELENGDAADGFIDRVEYTGSDFCGSGPPPPSLA